MAFEIFGKQELPIGFSLNTEVYLEREIRSAFKQMMDTCPDKKPRVLSMTSLAIINSLPTGETYVPSMLDYENKKDRVYTNFSIVLKHCVQGDDSIRKPADGLIWKEWDHIAVACYTKGAPVLYLEDSEGNRAMILLLRPALIKHGANIFTRLFETFKKDVTIHVACNSFQYCEWKGDVHFSCGTIFDYVSYLVSHQKIAGTAPNNFMLQYHDIGDSMRYYTRDDKYNNGIIAY